MIQRDISQVLELSDQEETHSLSTSVWIPLVSPVYDTSSSNSQYFHTLQSYNNTYSDQPQPGVGRRLLWHPVNYGAGARTLISLTVPKKHDQTRALRVAVNSPVAI
ncbi:unnamed protein product [Acanthoscelides obtectus]|uniref:Uncharacterized protein n=1 Tax=Acanthoscelides obtectus TaxID=200917 RepID=A0A9P0P3B3_ACAOB|nr:unnamed protein product [Acanthoscelides obtectus]CAK1648326.1 hypothetical protein AOBTE_LOCUS15676 [Acanthoscelides obtectus]